MNQAPILPILVPFATAVLALFLKRYGRVRTALAAAGALLTLAASIFLLVTVSRDGIQCYHLGGWIPPFGIVLTVDLLNATMAVLGSVVCAAALFYSFGYIHDERWREIFQPLFFILWASIHGAFLTGDIFNMFVFFEVMLISTYGLLCFFGEERQLEATLKMISMSLLASTFFLTAIGVTYAHTGTLNMADIARKIPEIGAPPFLLGIAFLFSMVFGMKAAMVPLHFWLPDAHSSAPTPVSAVLSGLLIKVGAYGLIRLGTLFMIPYQDKMRPVFIVVACVTMVLGAIGALAQTDLKRLLAYSSISQIGYILFGLALFTVGGISAALFFIISHALIKSTLFLTTGILKSLHKSVDMEDYSGLSTTCPTVAVLFLLGAMSLAGIPPMNGFFGKFMVLKEGYASGHPVAASIALGVGVVTLFYIMRAWQKISWGEKRAGMSWKIPAALRLPTAAMAAGCVLVGIFSGPVADYTQRVAEQVMDPYGPKGYVSVVNPADIGEMEEFQAEEPMLPPPPSYVHVAESRRGLKPAEIPTGEGKHDTLHP